MIPDPTLTLAWLILAHLFADFVLQNDWIAMTKSSRGGRGWVGALVHAGVVAVCLVPVPVAFGAPGLAYLLLIAVTHLGVDRWKVGATRRAEAIALAKAHARRANATVVEGPGSGLGSAWTPIPGVLYLVDQLVHLGITVAGWAFVLSHAALAAPFVSSTTMWFGAFDQQAFHAFTLYAVVIGSLVIANTKGAYFFIATLVHPREIVEGQPEPAEPQPAPPPAPPVPTGYTVRVGPLVATVEPGTPTTRATTTVDVVAEGADEAAESAVSRHVPRMAGSPARIGATIGVLERLLVVTFVLVGMEAAIGFVIAAKTLARFKQLDDRGFAEYYLLGTLASVLVALATALVGAAAIDTLP